MKRSSFLVCWSSGIFRCKGIQPKRQQICEPEPQENEKERKEKQKKRAYNERVQEMEHGSFTPIVMSATGGMTMKCSKFYSCLSEMIAEKRDQPYSVIASWIHRKISFSLIRSIGMCIGGSRSVMSSNDLLTSTISPPLLLFFFFLFLLVLEVYDWEEILVNLWLLGQEGKHPTGWIKCLRKKNWRKYDATKKKKMVVSHFLPHGTVFYAKQSITIYKKL